MDIDDQIESNFQPNFQQLNLQPNFQQLNLQPNVQQIIQPNVQQNIQPNVQPNIQNFPYTIIKEQNCGHEITYSAPVFECCKKAFACKQCHNNIEKHKRGKILEVYCKQCLTICRVGSKFCTNCRVHFGHTRSNDNDKNDDNNNNNNDSNSRDEGFERKSYRGGYGDKREGGGRGSGRGSGRGGFDNRNDRGGRFGR